MNLTQATQLLSPKQIRSIAGSRGARISIWSGAVRSGKTIASLIAFLIALATAPDQGLIIIVGRTLQTIERNVLDPLQDVKLFGVVALDVHHTRGSNTAVILGRTVHLIGASDARAEGRLRGLTAFLAYVDEGTLVPEAFFTQLLARLSVPGARLLVTTNPDSPAHWLRRAFILRAAELGLAHFHFALDDNPALDPAYVAALKAEYTGLWYRRFIEGAWCLAEGAIYDMWDEKRHVVDDLPDMIRVISLGVDYGTTNPTDAILIGLGADRCLYAIAEWRWDSKLERRALADVELSKRLRGWLGTVAVPGLPARPEYVVLDPAAASFKEQLYNDGVQVTHGDNAVVDGIQTICSLLSLGRLKVHSSCKHLLDEIPGYSWDDDKALKGEDAPVKVADHALDALRYGIYTTRALWRPYVLAA